MNQQSYKKKVFSLYLFEEEEKFKDKKFQKKKIIWRLNETWNTNTFRFERQD